MSGAEITYLRAAVRARDDRIAALERQLNAHHERDGLTGLPTRSVMLRHVEAAAHTARERGTLTAVVQLDIDRFGRLNAWLGSDSADAVLVEIASRLAAVVGPDDLVARVGADEFAIVCVGLCGDDEVHEAVGRLLAAVDRPVTVGARQAIVSASAGVAVAHDPATPASSIVADANSALERAKRRGGMCSEIFSRALREQLLDRLRIEHELRSAIERHELRVLFQPIIDVGRGQVSGFEALLRWRHPRLGMLSPDHFVSIAEESGLIRPIGEWVLGVTTRQIVEWRARRPELDLDLAVNLSARQLVVPETLLETVVDALGRSGLPARSLTLEVTETALIDVADEAEAATALGRLRALGVRLALDDFGTGYASVAQLKRLPFDTIKIDRSFVAALDETDGEDAQLVDAIVRMAKVLGLTVVAEGVENSGQLSRLTELGCTQAQGYLFAEPLAANRVDTLLEASQSIWVCH